MQTNDQTIPTLPSRDISKTVAFYQCLGFSGGAHGFNPDYAILQRGVIELHFFAHALLIPQESSFGCYIRVVDVESIYLAFRAANLPQHGIPRMDKLEDKPWGLREFAVVDPDGNLLRIGQII
ncbi:MAG: VOC family protein [Paraglaciecola sp.]|nr:VOC family protein [Paraglaciecola sp.]NCT49192.1 VOC family protein [Paraglaciecola sp.]